MRIPKWLPLLIILVIVLLPLGAAAGFQVGVAWNAGRLARWRRLPALPGRATRIAGGSTAAVYVEAAGGQVYVCNHLEALCWARYDEPVISDLSNEYCEQWPTRYAVAAPPGQPVDYLQARWCHFEAGEESDYALMADGSLWVWNHWDANFLNLARVFGAMGGGACAGLLVGVAVPVFAWRRERRRQASAAQPAVR